ncbi:MAG: large-conductance mechanosensitive channel protein MscL [Ruminococcaceae bacterium]|nr:large-conductance mechanosensitive channel protein MscL [Oscillospiraceae bacterium]
MLKDFKAFAMKGNVMDMAIGVIVGGAFGKIVTSIVNDLIMPCFGFLTAGMDFKALKFVLSPAVIENDTIVKAEAAIMYGNFLQNVLDFLIISFSIFFIIRMLTKARKAVSAAKAVEEAEEKAEEPAPPTQEELLTEIRDLLKNVTQTKDDVAE